MNNKTRAVALVLVVVMIFALVASMVMPYLAETGKSQKKPRNHLIPRLFASGQQRKSHSVCRCPVSCKNRPSPFCDRFYAPGAV